MIKIHFGRLLYDFSLLIYKPFSKVMNRSDKPWKTTWFDGATELHTRFLNFQSNDQQSLSKRNESFAEISWQELYNKTLYSSNYSRWMLKKEIVWLLTVSMRLKRLLLFWLSMAWVLLVIMLPRFWNQRC